MNWVFDWLSKFLFDNKKQKRSKRTLKKKNKTKQNKTRLANERQHCYLFNFQWRYRFNLDFSSTALKFFFVWSAPQVSGWDVSVINITEDSFQIEWTALTSEIDQSVEVYVVIVASTTRHDVVNGRIVTSSTSSLWLHGLIPYHEYNISVVAVDVLGQPHKSNEIIKSTHESGNFYEISLNRYQSWSFRRK